MRFLRQTLTLLALAAILTSCGKSSQFGSGSSSKRVTVPNDNVTPYKDGTPGNANYKTNHCLDIQGQEHLFYNMIKGIADKNALAELLEDGGICSTQGGRWVNYNGYWQWEEYHGTQHCSWWNQQPVQVWLSFQKGYPQYASMRIAATGNGEPQGSGQAFPTAPIDFTNGMIDCSNENLSISFKTRRGIIKVIGSKEYGTKYDLDFRATLYYNDKKIGTGFFSR